MRLNRYIVTALSLLIAASASAAPLKYTIDKDHSNIGFSVRHMMISNVSGQFKDFEGSFTFDADKALVTDGTFSAKTDSVDTGNAKRDEHLKSADFFDAAKYPTITFTDSKLKKVSKDKFKWSGTLNMHGVSKQVTFDLEYRGAVKDAWGNMVAGFSASTNIKRSDWGLKWNKALEAGGVAVSDDVKLMLDVEAKQAATAPAAPASPAPVEKKSK